MSAQHVSATFVLTAIGLDLPVDPNHPNRHPFSGIVTRIDEPSDMGVGGAKGHKTLIPRAVAEKALDSFLGMAVDLRPDLKGHDRKHKIGVITTADIDGNAIRISGFLYAADFPDEVARIIKEKNELGFSYEATSRIADIDAPIWVFEDCKFTGAAILYKRDAAYQTTELAAQINIQEQDMTEVEKSLATLTESMTKIGEQIGKLSKDNEAIAKKVEAMGTELEANMAVRSKVSPHTDALRACAASMEAAGVGAHPTRGHATQINRMANSMDAEAAMGKVPHIYRDHDFLTDAAAHADAGPKPGKGGTLPPENKDITELKGQLASVTTMLTDLKASAFQNATPPERKTISPEIKSLLSKNGFEAAADGKEKLTIDQANKILDAQGLHGVAAIEAKAKWKSAGITSF